MIEWLKRMIESVQQEYRESVAIFYKSAPGAGGIDSTLIVLWLTLMSIGLVMIASASIAFAAEQYADPWFFVKRQGFYVALSLLLAAGAVAVPVRYWQANAGWLMLVVLALLVLVLLPGLGREVNGARRWLNLGVFSIQVSELAKLATIVFFARFFARRHNELYTGWRGFMKPLLVLGFICGLLLLQPDFGSVVVLAWAALAMMFIAGVKLKHFALLIGCAALVLAMLVVYKPYRMERLVSFLDPWSVQFDSGYQLTQSLIAFGRGEWLGLGLGNSLQKLFYLPEAHTDFIAAIAAEEFGLLGLVLLLGIFGTLIYRLFAVAKHAFDNRNLFPAFASFGVAALFTIQVFINVSVAAGLLPTKGLTLPFISYGGSSLLISSVFIAFVLRVNWEQKHKPASLKAKLARAPAPRSMSYREAA